MQNSVGDTIQIHKSTVCRTVRRVALALCTRMYDFVYMLVDNKKLNDTRHKFHAMAGFPGVIGCFPDVIVDKLLLPQIGAACVHWMHGL